MAFAFGVPSKIKPNQLIAEIALKEAKKLGAPIYTQLDISIEDKEVKVAYTKEKRGNPPPTLRIARGAVDWANKLGLKELWIVAAVPHLKRCKRDLRFAVDEDREKKGRTGLKIGVFYCKDIKKHQEEEWYCSQSEQKRTRSSKDWRWREKMLLMMPMSLYKRIAG